MNDRPAILYVPKSKAVERDGRYGKFLCLSFKAKELRDFINEHVNADGYINLNVSPRKQLGEYGDSHSISLNQWKPTPRDGAPRSSAPAEPDPPPATGEEESDPVPF